MMRTYTITNIKKWDIFTETSKKDSSLTEGDQVKFEFIDENDSSS